MSSTTLTIALLGAVFLLGAAGEASAQDVQSQQIAVDVRDADGTPVEGAEVTLRPVQGDNTYETQAVGGGEYRGEAPLRYLNDRFKVLVDAGPRGEGTEKARWWGAGTVMRVFVNLGGEENAEQEPSQSSPDPESSTTGQPVFTTTSTLEIQSSLGHPITNATAQLTFRSGLNVQETPTEETKTYDHRGGGTYKVQLEGLRDPGRYEYTIDLSAPGHAGQTITPIALNSERSVELIHNDYVARCNKDWDDDESGFLGKESPWADCEIDSERLIETFGTKTKRFQTKPVPEDVDPRTPIEQLPSILSSFEVYRFHPKFHAAEPLQYGARQSQYQTLIEQIVRGPALAKAYAANEAIADLIEKRRATEEPSVEVEEVAAQGASVVAGFAEKFSAVADAIGAAGDVLNVLEANERGVLNGLIQYAVLQTGVQQEALEQFKTQAREARIWDDPAFQQAIEAVEQKLKDQRQMGPREVANAYARDEIGDVVGDVLLGTTVKGVVGALLAAAKAGAAVKTGGAVLAYDLLKSAIDRSQARTLLALSPLIDRQVLSEFPDNLEEADLQAMRPAEKRGALMRLTLGTVFNESRAAYLAGENKSWLGQGWDFAIEAMPIDTEADAYDAEMVRVSVEKSERAETEIDRLTATLAANDGTRDITLQTRGQKVLARSDEGIEWRFATKRPEPSVSKRDGGVAYVVDGKEYRAEASHVYALEVTTGDLLWKKEIGGYTQSGLLRVSNGTLIVEHSSGIYALNAKTGGTQWVYDDFDDETTSFTFAEGTLLFLDGMPSSGHEMMGSRSPSTLHAINLETGQGRWSKAVVPERHPRPTSHARYSVQGEVVTAENTRTGRTYRLDLTTGEPLKDSGPSRCATTQAEKIADEAFGAWGPTEDSPEVTFDLNGDGAKERFYQMSGTNRLGQIKVVTISGAAPCSQIFSIIVYESDWTEKLTVLNRQRNGYQIIGIRGLRYAFDGERYVRMEEETSESEPKGVELGGCRYFLTDEKYDSGSQDIPSLIEKYGSEAELADWKNLKSRFAGSKSQLLTFLDEVGMTEQGNDAFVQRGGNRFYGGNRHYFMTRHGGDVPENYLVHDEMYSNTVSLGSWSTAKRALVCVPK